MADPVFDTLFPNYRSGQGDKKCIQEAVPVDKREQPTVYDLFFGFGVIVGFTLIDELPAGGEARATIVSLQDPNRQFTGVVYDPMGMGFRGCPGAKGYASPVYIKAFDQFPGNNAPTYRRKLFAGSAVKVDPNNFKFVIVNMECPTECSSQNP